jgi:hypothetical protein
MGEKADDQATEITQIALDLRLAPASSDVE